MKYDSFMMQILTHFFPSNHNKNVKAVKELLSQLYLNHKCGVYTPILNWIF